MEAIVLTIANRIKLFNDYALKKYKCLFFFVKHLEQTGMEIQLEQIEKLVMVCIKRLASHALDEVTAFRACAAFSSVFLFSNICPRLTIYQKRVSLGGMK